MGKDFDILDRCISLTIRVIEVAERLKQVHHYVIADQVVRSTGGIGANVAEAQAARSKTEFESINNIALKEAKETIYWLTVIEKLNIVDSQRILNLKKESCEIANIIAAIILSSKSRKRKRYR